jgi:hypothetical protein
MPRLQSRFGTLHDNRGFYAWYLAQRRLARHSPPVAGDPPPPPPPDDAPRMDSVEVTMDETKFTMDSN